MLVTTCGTMLAESSGVPRALFYLGFRIDVTILALVAVRALTKTRVEPALGHLRHVKFLGRHRHACVFEIQISTFLTQLYHDHDNAIELENAPYHEGTRT